MKRIFLTCQLFGPLPRSPSQRTRRRPGRFSIGHSPYTRRQQLIQGSELYTESPLKTLTNVMSRTTFAHRMATAHPLLHRIFQQWECRCGRRFTRPAKHLRENSLPWMNAATTGNGAAAAYQKRQPFPEPGNSSGYSTLNASKATGIAAQGSNR